MYNSDYDNPNEKPIDTSNKQTKPSDFLEDEEKVGLLADTKIEIEMKHLNSPLTSSVDSTEVIKSRLSPMPVTTSINLACDNNE